MRWNHDKQFKRLSPIQYRKLKAAMRHEMEMSKDFDKHEISIFLEMMDRVGRDDITQFLFIATKFSDLEISQDSWNFAEIAITEAEEEKKARRGR